MSYAPELRAVRTHFGLSQPMLARWLGLSRALLASVETEREKLPDHARPWVWAWQAALAVSEAAHPDPPHQAQPAFLPPPPGPAALLARLAECQYQAQRRWWELAAARQRLLYYQRQLAAGPVLLAALPPAPDANPTDAPALRRRWLQRLLEAATDALLPEAAQGPSALVLLDARQQAFLHEAAYLRAYLAGEASG